MVIRLEIIDSLILKLLVSILLILSINSFLALMLTLINLRFNPYIFIFMYLNINLILYKLCRSRFLKLGTFIAKIKNQKYNLLIYLILVIVPFAFVNTSLITKGFSVNNIIKISTQGEDNISHSEMIRFNHDSHKEYMANDVRDVSYIHPSLSTYPQGIHANIAILLNALESFGVKDFDGYDFYIVEWLIISFLYAVLFASSLYFLIETICSRLNFRIERVGVSISSLFFLCASMLTYGISLLKFGFLTHIASLLILLAQLQVFHVFTKLNSLKPFSSNNKQHILIVVLITLTFGVANIWLFLWPVSFIITQIAIIMESIPNSLNIKNINGLIKRMSCFIRAIHFKYFIPYSLLLALTSAQFLLEKFFGGNGSINAKGAIDKIDFSVLVFIIFIIASTLILIAFSKNKRSIWHIVPAIVIILFTAASVAYQLHTVREVRYYSIKSMYSLFVAIPLSVRILLTVLDKYSISLRRLHVYMFALIYSILSASSIYKMLQHGQSYYFNRNGQRMSDNYIRRSIDAVNNSSMAIFEGQCNKAQDYILSRLTNSMSGGLSGEERLFLENYTLFKTKSVEDAPTTIEDQDIYTDDVSARNTTHIINQESCDK